jgi:hypothetical protein
MHHIAMDIINSRRISKESCVAYDTYKKYIVHCCEQSKKFELAV